MITPVLLCGGSGTRLWPLSRRSFTAEIAGNGRLQVLDFGREFGQPSVWDMAFFRLLDLPAAARTGEPFGGTAAQPAIGCRPDATRCGPIRRRT